MQPTVTFHPLAPDVQPPRRQTAQSAGYDVHAYLRGTPATVMEDGQEVKRVGAPLKLAPGQRALVPLGFKARIPEGYHGEVRPRSGAAFRKGLEIPNSPGTVDSDYNGEWMVVVKNGSDVPITIDDGERIAQVVFVPHVSVEFAGGEVVRTTERDGGFGSTGR
jgi:dUTP pyrophosphatase